MRIVRIIAACVLFGALPLTYALNAQVNYPPIAGITQAQLDAMAATIPQPATTPPPMEAVGGTAGMPGTYRPATAVQPRITRTKPFTTVTGGTAVISWADMGATPLVYVQENVSATDTNVPSCFPVSGTITSTGVTVKCYITQSILGLGVLPFTVATAGVVGQVLAIPQSS